MNRTTIALYAVVALSLISASALAQARPRGDRSDDCAEQRKRTGIVTGMIEQTRSSLIRYRDSMVDKMVDGHSATPPELVRCREVSQVALVVLQGDVGGLTEMSFPLEDD